MHLASTQKTVSAPEQPLRLGDQVARMQERQLELIRQTSEELDQLRRELESQENEKQPLQEEIEFLRGQVTALEERHAKEREEMQAVLDSLKATVGGQIRTIHQQLRLLSLETLEGLERVLDKVDAASLPPMTAAASLPAVLSAAKLPSLKKAKVAPVEQAVAKPLQEAAPRAKPVRKTKRLIRRTLSFAFALGVVWLARNLMPHQAGQVAGASTDASIVSATPATSVQEPEYKEAQSDLPFDQTTWSTFSDPVFGVSVEYPDNTSNLAHAVSSDNVFFVRKEGFMMKVTKVQTSKSFNEYMQQAQNDYGTQYTLKQGTFTNRTAYVGTPLVHDQFSGTLYFVPRPPSATNPAAPGNTFIYQIWIKDEAVGSDDARRLDRMVNSFQFLNVK